VKLLREHAYSLLLSVLVLYFVAMPLAKAMDRAFLGIAIYGIFVLVLTVAVFAEHGGISWRRPAVYMIALLVILRAIDPIRGGDFANPEYRWFQVAVEIVTAGFLFQISYSLLRSVTSGSRVGRETIAGVSAVYILLALAFGALHVAVFLAAGEHSVAYVGSVMGWGDVIKEGSKLKDWAPDFTYLSVVTQTTLGYGDIAPKSSVARGLVMTQTIVGQLYIAIVIARIVAMELAHRRLDDSQ